MYISKMCFYVSMLFFLYVDDFISTQFFMNKIHKFAGYEDPNTFFRPAIRSFLVRVLSC